MVDNNKPSDEHLRELYARFGLAYYHSEVLHRGLCIILAMSGLRRRDLITRPRVEERLAHAFSLTLGDVIRELKGKIPDEYNTQLDQALDVRNFLAHHFWFDRAHLMFRANQVNKLIEELDGYAKLFGRLDTEVSRSFEGTDVLRVTNDVLEDCMARIVSGHSEDPLPNKETIRDLDKKLKQRQRLVQVWEITLPDGGKPLVFETQDGSLWQLSDVGLSWTRFEHVEQGWIEHPAIRPYLPAYIIPRPKDARPWRYEFRLRKGAVLWVKPGKHERTFQWGIRTKK